MVEMKCLTLGFVIASSGRSVCELPKAAAFVSLGFHRFCASGGVHQSTDGSGLMFHASDTEYLGTWFFIAER